MERLRPVPESERRIPEPERARRLREIEQFVAALTQPGRSGSDMHAALVRAVEEHLENGYILVTPTGSKNHGVGLLQNVAARQVTDKLQERSAGMVPGK